MNGVHDMGGMDGFGRVEPEANEPVFHAAWEGRVMAMTRAVSSAAAWPIDRQRYAREQLPPAVYLSVSYYERWLLALRGMLLDCGFVGADELAAGRALRSGSPLPRGPFRAADAPRVTVRGSYTRAAAAPARFSPGDRVRTRNIHPATHTRLPRYARGHVGTVERVQGCHAFPDAVASGHGDSPQWLYTVMFEGRELWGADTDPSLRVSIEAFEPYLETA